MAERPATIEEAEMKLELKNGELTEMLEEDIEVRDIWRTKRLELVLSIKDSLAKAVKAGKLQAIKNIEKILTNEMVSLSKIDIHRLTIKQMEEITGKTRQTIHNWHTKYGLRRNSDSTFDLTVFVAWLEDFSVTKNLTSTKIDPLRQLKIERLKDDLEKDRGQLIERPTILAGILARHQRLLGSLSEGRRKQLASAILNQPQTTIDEILSNYFSDILKEQLELPETLKLSEETEKKFKEVLVMLESN